MSHSHNHESNDRSIKLGLVLNTLFTIVEFFFGAITGSLALVADATHNLTDTFTLTVSYMANKLARRKANTSKTYGYGRATILAALLNALVMLGVAAFIVTEAIQRLNRPHPVDGGIVAIVASVGILINGYIAFILYKNRKDLNMRSAFIDMAFDALSSLGAVIAGIFILLTGVVWVDSLIGFIIAALLVFNTFKIIGEAIHILLEGIPKDINIVAINELISSTDKVLSVDDMHVWAIRSGYNALSCHIVIANEDLLHSREIVVSIKQKLKTDFNIQHATIEVEFEESAIQDTHENH